MQPPFDPNQQYRPPLPYDPGNPYGAQHPPQAPYDPYSPYGAPYNPYAHQQYPQGYAPYDQHLPELPNASSVLVLGILSIVFSGFGGAILSAIALTMASSARSLFEQEPGRYSRISLNKVETGRICSFIGIGLFFLFALMWLLIFASATQTREEMPYEYYEF